MSLKNVLFIDLLQRIPPKTRRIINTFLILVILTIAYFFVSVWTVQNFYYSYLHNSVYLSVYILILACVPSIIYFIIDAVIRKARKNAILPSIQVFLFFSALPYALLYEGWGIYSFLNTFGTVLFRVIFILPEAFAFFGLIWLRKHNITIAIIFIIIAGIFSSEFIPQRMIFFYDADVALLMRPSGQEKFAPFGKEDREFEFKRSLHIIEELLVKSKNVPRENVKKIIIYEPNLSKYPNILRLDTLYYPPWHAYAGEYWEKIKLVFQKKEYLLDVKLDTDGDGLSDFEEAEILSDAFNKDTDGDGIMDNEDTDPLNQFTESDFAHIKTAILKNMKIWPDSNAVYLIDNDFYNGHGEFNNFKNHIIILHPDQITKWTIIFGEQYMPNRFQRSLYGQRVYFGKYMMDLTTRLVIIGVIQFHGVWEDCSIFVFCLMKWNGKWRLIAANCLGI